MNVIFEGPDNVGKGTTITNFRNKYNETAWSGIYYTGVKMEPKMQYSYMVNLFGKMWKIFELDNIISDRSHISEAVFAYMYRGMSKSDIDILFTQEKVFKDKKTVLIMLIDSPENLLDREDGLSHSQTVEQKQKEIDLYLDMYERSILPKMVVNVHDKDPGQVIEYIDKMLKELHVQ